MRIKPLRYREFVVVTPTRVPGGYTNEFYTFEAYPTLRPHRTYRQHIKPLYKIFRLDRARFDAGIWFFFDLLPGVEPAPLPEHLVRLREIARAIRNKLGDENEW